MQTMANSGFDPLRDDPFASVHQSPAIVPVAPTHPGNNQWGLQQPPPQPPSNDDILLQFNNTNSPTNDVTRTTVQRSRHDSSASQSSLGSRSARSASSMFGNPNIAPPPSFPAPRDYTQSQFMAEEEVNPAPPPDFNEVTHSGNCIARISMRTLVMKKWKRAFWIT